MSKPDYNIPPWGAEHTVRKVGAQMVRTRHPQAAEFTAALRTLTAYYKPLVDLGMAVLDEHRSVLLAERNLQNPELQADARANAEYVQELLQSLLQD